MTRRRSSACIAMIVLVLTALLSANILIRAQGTRSAGWRVTNEDELRSIIPARAAVVAERIETEFRTASGITDGHGRFVAGVVLITAGYSAEGKYSHYLLTQVPMKVANLSLPPGQYVFGWTRKEETLTVHFYDAATGRELGQIEAARNSAISRVESFRIWPPSDRAVIQLGRFTFSYSLGG